MRDAVRPDDLAASGTDADGEPVSFRRGGTIPALFAWCVNRYPDAPAVIHDQVRLTYADLDALSDRYAAAPELDGVGTGDFVPVVMKRSPELIGALLALLKRGAAYSALDPRWPQARLDALVSRLHARLVVTDANGPWAVPAWAPPRYDPAAPRCHGDPAPVGPDDPCTILFTSGTTGEPKGVVSAHRSTARLFDACDWMPVGPELTISQMASPSWDGFTIECWGPLLTGGTTVIVDEPILVPAALSELRDRYHLNTMFLTPSLFNMLVEEGVQSFAGLGTVLIGGEKASALHAKRFLESHPGSHLVNLYGPAECGVLVSTHDISLADCVSADGIPLGHAAPHTGLHVLDGTEVCGEGQVAEICASGAALAIGYLDDPELTARKFVSADILGACRTVYRTGDLGHWSGGKLCFDGRADLQVQVHGHRVEREEIELVTAGVTGVTMSAVVPLWHNGQVDALALFYASPQGGVSEADLRAELSRQLPAYMVPRQIRRLDRLPLLTSGKLDRQLLEAIVSDAGAPAQPPAAAEDPRGATQIAVTDAFAAILGTSPVPPNVSFFDLGGDSLLVARLCARLKQATGATVGVSQVFRTPTVAGLAAWIDTARPAAPVAERAASPHVRLTPMQTILVATQVVSRFGWWLAEPVDADALERAAGDVHRRHQALHARYFVSGSEVGYASLPPDPGRVHFRRLPPAPTDAAAVDGLREILMPPLRLDEGEVWRCVLAHSVASGRGLLGIAAHHAAFDGTSAGIMTTELGQAYAARNAGAAPVFAEPAAALAEFDTDYRAQLAAIDLDAQRRYWRGEFSGLEPCRFPGYTSAPSASLGPATARSFTLESGRLQPWEAYGRSQGMTAFGWFAAAYADALIKAGARRDLGMLFAFAKRGNDLLDRSITSRMGLGMLRPYGPSRQGRNLLARVHDANNSARATQDVLFDPAEIRRALSEARTEYSVLQGCPYLLYHDQPRVAIQLGDITGTSAPEVGGWSSMGSDLCLEVQAGQVARVVVRVAVRTDTYPADLADGIGELFLQTISDGPGRLEQRTEAR